MNDKLLFHLQGNTTIYPYNLEEHFPRVFNKMVELCDSKLLDAYLLDLMVDNQGGSRQGFPPDAATEIIRLSNFRSAMQAREANGSVWDKIPQLKRVEIERLGFSFTPQSFLKAIDQGNKDAIHLFLSCGADLEAKDERDWTPLMFAISTRNAELALLLIKCGAKITSRDKNGFTPLHWAAQNGLFSVVEALLEKGAEVNIKSKFGWTALMQACTFNYLKIASFLLDSGADVDLKSNDGTSALHIAASKGNADIVRLLLSRAANHQLANQDGKTPVMLAEKLGHTQVVEMLSAPVITGRSKYDLL